MAGIMGGDHLKRAGGVFVYSLMAILGVITANAIDSAAVFQSSGMGAWIKLVLGAVIFAVPVIGIRGNSGWEGPVRMYLGVTGLTVFLRAILDGPSAGLTGLNASLPVSVQQVI